MAEVTAPQPVELVIGCIAKAPGPPQALAADLAAVFGPVELVSPVFEFDVTGYYEDEMGPHLVRVFFAFENMIDPAGIVEVKLSTNRIEAGRARNGRRTVNLDPGYMDFYKLVLASNKFMGQKIYLGKGVYADPALYYDKGWTPYEWGFPDFRSGRYYGFLTEVRRAYKSKIRNRGHIVPSA